MSATIGESVGESSMVTNVELVKEVDEKKEKNIILQESLEEVKIELDAVANATKKRNKLSLS